MATFNSHAKLAARSLGPDGPRPAMVKLFGRDFKHGQTVLVRVATDRGDDNRPLFADIVLPQNDSYGVAVVIRGHEPDELIRLAEILTDAAERLREARKVTPATLAAVSQ